MIKNEQSFKWSYKNYNYLHQFIYLQWLMLADLDLLLSVLWIHQFSIRVTEIFTQFSVLILNLSETFILEDLSESSMNLFEDEALLQEYFCKSCKVKQIIVILK